MTPNDIVMQFADSYLMELFYCAASVKKQHSV